MAMKLLVRLPVKKGSGFKNVAKLTDVDYQVLKLVIRCKSCMRKIRKYDPETRFSPLMAVVAQIEHAYKYEAEKAKGMVDPLKLNALDRTEVRAAREALAPVIEKLSAIESAKNTGRIKGRFVSRSQLEKQAEEVKKELAHRGAQALAMTFNSGRISNRDKKLARQNGGQSASM
ncbi:MAG: hypothetical protein AAB384_02180 [Patescibacteria group bacterium]